MTRSRSGTHSGLIEFRRQFSVSLSLGLSLRCAATASVHAKKRSSEADNNHISLLFFFDLLTRESKNCACSSQASSSDTYG